MAILTDIEIKNFECFKEKERFKLNNATFFIGENNSGKSSIFRAICLFFGEINFEKKFLNDTTYKAKKAKRNITEISITFDLSEIKLKIFKQRLLSLNNKSTKLTITVQYKYKNKNTEIIYLFKNNKGRTYEDLNEDLQRLIGSIKINFIHPQQGAELLKKAKEKLQNRLLDNWGRKSSISKELNSLDQKWQQYKEEANFYLSNILTERIQKIWGQGEVSINLPDSIKDIIKIGDVSFKARDGLPPIPLTSHGTGVQQSLLYYASLILDSDTTLRRKQEYHPVWLLEEPESFLHADMIIKLSHDLTSEDWLRNIQLLTTTHSGLLLSNSINNKSKTLWNILSQHQLIDSYNPQTTNSSKINEIGKIMGDPNFEVYFDVNKNYIFIEDAIDILINEFKCEGIKVKGLGGMDNLKKYITVLQSNNFTKAYFIVDNDKGFKKLEKQLHGYKPEQLQYGFTLYKLKNNTNVIVLPENHAMESLFEGFETYIDEGVDKLVTPDNKLRENIPKLYVATCNKLHSKYQNNPIPRNEVKAKLKKDDNVKHQFWLDVKKGIYQFKKEHIKVLQDLLVHT